MYVSPLEKCSRKTYLSCIFWMFYYMMFLRLLPQTDYSMSECMCVCVCLCIIHSPGCLPVLSRQSGRSDSSQHRAAPQGGRADSPWPGIRETSQRPGSHSHQVCLCVYVCMCVCTPGKAIFMGPFITLSQCCEDTTVTGARVCVFEERHTVLFMSTFLFQADLCHV